METAPRNCRFLSLVVVERVLIPGNIFPDLRSFWSRQLLGNVSETPSPTTCQKSTATHLQFVRQYAPHLYCCTFLASKLRRKGNPAIRLPFVLQYAPPFVRQYAPHLYGSTFGKILGVGVTGTFLREGRLGLPGQVWEFRSLPPF